MALAPNKVHKDTREIARSADAWKRELVRESERVQIADIGEVIITDVVKGEKRKSRKFAFCVVALLIILSY